MNIKEVSYKKDDINGSLLVVKFKGEHAVYQIINPIRQACINQIPIYAFDASKINIIKNTTVFDNTEMKLRLSQLPINNITSESLDIDNEEYEIESYVRKKNDTFDIMYINTNDLIIKINNKLIDNKEMYSKEYPIVLTKLRSGEEFECSLKSVLNIGEYNSIYNGSNCYWQKISDEEYDLKIESNGQNKEYNMLIKVCDILINKFKMLHKNFSNEQYKVVTFGKNKVIIEINNENYMTFGPINYMLQNIKDVEMSGISRTSYLEKKMQLTIKTYNDDQITNILTAINNCISLYTNIKNDLIKIFKKKL